MALFDEDDPDTADQAGRSPKGWVSALVLVRVVVALIAVTNQLGGPPADGDILRFHEIGVSAGLPYVDFPVEYPPLETLLILGLQDDRAGVVGARVASVALAADLSTWLLLRTAAGRSAGLRYLALGLPLIPFIYLRLDLVPVAMAVAGVVLARSRLQTLGGVAIAVAALTKVWAGVLLPGLWLDGRRRSFVAGVVASIVGVVAWVMGVGWSGVAQVLTFRNASGWGVESTVGTIIWSVSGQATRLESGAPRIATMILPVSIGLSVLSIATIVAVWWVAWRLGADPFGVPALAAVAALIAFSPVYSLQYAAWLIPWAAFDDGRWGRAHLRLTWIVSTLTGALFIMYASLPLGLAKPVLLARNGATVAIPVIWLAAHSKRPSPRRDRSTSGEAT